MEEHTPAVTPLYSSAAAVLVALPCGRHLAHENDDDHHHHDRRRNHDRDHNDEKQTPRPAGGWPERSLPVPFRLR